MWLAGPKSCGPTLLAGVSQFSSTLALAKIASFVPGEYADVSISASNVRSTNPLLEDFGCGPSACHLDIPAVRALLSILVGFRVTNSLELLIVAIVSIDGYVPSLASARLVGRVSHGPRTNSVVSMLNAPPTVHDTLVGADDSGLPRGTQTTMLFSKYDMPLYLRAFTPGTTSSSSVKSETPRIDTYGSTTSIANNANRIFLAICPLSSPLLLTNGWFLFPNASRGGVFGSLVSTSMLNARKVELLYFVFAAGYPPKVFGSHGMTRSGSQLPAKAQSSIPPRT
mmetsp:Transcript_10051/g.21729  ORF Transcript_10051/g.21729 Transcript_10051/m.21729 type:complete len:283 (-) Transcript_10051:114-962(-)